MPSAVDLALGKMQRSLTTFFGRKEWAAAAVSKPASAAKESVAKKAADSKTAIGTKVNAVVKKAAVEKPAKLETRDPKKKKIYQARRKPWPAR